MNIEDIQLITLDLAVVYLILFLLPCKIKNLLLFCQTSQLYPTKETQYSVDFEEKYSGFFKTVMNN